MHRRFYSLLITYLLASSSALAYSLSDTSVSADDMLKQVEEISKIIVPKQMTNEEILKNLQDRGCHLELIDQDKKKLVRPNPFDADLAFFRDSKGYGCFKPFSTTWQRDKVVISLKVGFDSIDEETAKQALDAKYGDPVGGYDIYEGYVYAGQNYTIRLLRDFAENQIQILSATLAQDLLRKNQLAAEERAKAEAEAEKARIVAKHYKGRVLGIFTPGETNEALVQAVINEHGCSIGRDGVLVGDAGPCIDLPGSPLIYPLMNGEHNTKGLKVILKYSASPIDKNEKRMSVQEAFAQMKKKVASELKRLPNFTSEYLSAQAYGDENMVVLMMPEMKADAWGGIEGLVYFVSRGFYEAEIERQQIKKNDLLRMQRQKEENLKNIF